MRRRAPLLAALACLAACRPRPAPVAAPDADAPPAAPARAPAPVDPPAPSPARWAITAREAQSHGLSPLGFSLDEPPRSLIATRFPAPGMLALFAGPPGGPLGALVEADGLSGGDALTLREALRTLPSARLGAPRELGSPEAVPLGGADRPAVAMLAGEGRARTHYCVVAVPPPEGAARGLLVWLYVDGSRAVGPSCAAVLAHPVTAGVARALRLETL